MSTRTSRMPRERARFALGCLAVAGFACIMCWALLGVDAGRILDDFATLGPALGYLLAFHLIVVACDGASWRVLLRGRKRGSSRLFFWARWVREATNLLLPAAQVGGEIIATRVLVLRAFLNAERRRHEEARIGDDLAEAFERDCFDDADGMAHQAQRGGPLGPWAIALGFVAALSVAIAALLAERLELRIGEKTVPSRAGFDFDDALFALVPALWCGFLTPLLVGAAIGGPLAALYIGYRLAARSTARRSLAPAP